MQSSTNKRKNKFFSSKTRNNEYIKNRFYINENTLNL